MTSVLICVFFPSIHLFIVGRGGKEEEGEREVGREGHRGKEGERERERQRGREISVKSCQEQECHLVPNYVGGSYNENH